jgi:2-polyprenyl-3-methyl-5-hydroxy-6-metoxy-1,4-benzoquinol methylase
MKRINCVICGDSNHVTLSNKGRWGLKITTVSCSSCGLVFTNPQLDAEENKAFYEVLHKILYHGSDAPLDEYVETQSLKAKKIHKNLKSRIGDQTDKSILEIGCSAGGMLDYFRRQGFQKVYGLEPSVSHVKYAQEALGLNVEQGFIENFEPGMQFDIVILRDVLEHVLDPNLALQKIHEIVHDDTIIYIDTNNVWNPLKTLEKYDYHFHYAHPYTFSAISLSNLMEKNDFDCEIADDGRNMIAFCKRNHGKSKNMQLQTENPQSVIKFIKKHDRTLPLRRMRRMLGDAKRKAQSITQR